MAPNGLIKISTRWTSHGTSPVLENTMNSHYFTALESNHKDWKRERERRKGNRTLKFEEEFSMLSATRHHSHDSAKRSFIYYYSKDAQDESLKKNAEQVEEARLIFLLSRRENWRNDLEKRFDYTLSSVNNFSRFRRDRFISIERARRIIIRRLFFSFFSSLLFFTRTLAPKSIKFVHGRLPKARQTRHARVEIELKSNGRRINESTNRCIRNAITEYKTSECFSRRINSFFPRIFIVSIDPK